MIARAATALRRTLVVQKYGGTSLATPALIARAARRVLAAKREGADVVVVVSAMAGETDRLLALAKGMGSGAPARELDVVAAAGEQVSAGLMAIALRAAGGTARSWLGYQVPIRTDSIFGSAQITSLDSNQLRTALDASEIPVIAGFQGIDSEGNLTTLGRGGSDTTAVAVAAAVGATCEIYTDVEGVYTIDPRVSSHAKRLSVIGYRTMHALAASGAKVLETRSVELAMRHKVPVHVRSSQSPAEGTWVIDDRDERVRDVAGIAIARRTVDGASVAEVSVIGPNVALRSERIDTFATLGVTVLASRKGPMGTVYVVRPDDATRAACALHAAHGLEDKPRPPRSSPPFLAHRASRTEEMERTR